MSATDALSCTGTSRVRTPVTEMSTVGAACIGGTGTDVVGVTAMTPAVNSATLEVNNGLRTAVCIVVPPPELFLLQRTYADARVNTRQRATSGRVCGEFSSR